MELRTFREKRGASLDDAAKQIGVTVGYLSLVERGLKLPSAPVMRRIQEWSGKRVRPNDLFDNMNSDQLADRPARRIVAKRERGTRK